MPRKKVAGRDRMDVKADPVFLDTVAQFAEAANQNMSAYVVQAVRDRMIREGWRPPVPVVTPEPEPPAPPQPKRPRGRPKKGSA